MCFFKKRYLSILVIEVEESSNLLFENLRWQVGSGQQIRINVNNDN